MLRQNKSLLRSAAVVALTFGVAAFANAQAPAPAQAPAAAPAAPPTAKASAPIDLTGYWVSVITEDWRWRMVTPAKGDYASVPINVAAKDLADQWDPAKDEAAGEQCKAYGAPAIMRVPQRAHVTWQDDNTLKLETDAGEQTRLFHFGDWKPATGAAATWQGNSVATWEGVPRGNRGGGGGGGGGAAAPPAAAPAAGGGNGGGGNGGGGGRGGAPAQQYGNLKVVTTHIRPGYLRKNGIPYSDKATLTEYWDLSKEQFMSGTHKNEQWVVITTILDDPVYLQDQWLTSLNFKKEADGSKWNPQPCSSRW